MSVCGKFSVWNTECEYKLNHRILYLEQNGIRQNFVWHNIYAVQNKIMPNANVCFSSYQYVRGTKTICFVQQILSSLFCEFV